MNKLVILAAFALAAATTHAAACDWQHQANATPVIVASTCDGGNCATEAAAATDQGKSEPTAQEQADSQDQNGARPAPAEVAVADCGGGNCRRN